MTPVFTSTGHRHANFNKLQGFGGVVVNSGTKRGSRSKADSQSQPTKLRIND